MYTITAYTMVNECVPIEITVSLPPHLGKALAGIAAAEEKSFTDILLQAVEAYVQPSKPKRKTTFWSEKIYDEAKLAKLYASFCKEDSKLAEEGMTNYIVGLNKEDL